MQRVGGFSSQGYCHGQAVTVLRDGNAGFTYAAQIAALDTVASVASLIHVDFTRQDFLLRAISQHQHRIFLAGEVILD